LSEIKEMITKQDVRDLKESGAIIIKNINGRKKKEERRKKRKVGNIRKKIKQRKREYIALTRKLRNHLHEVKQSEELRNEDILDIRKKIRNRFFKSKSHLRGHIKEITK